MSKGLTNTLVDKSLEALTMAIEIYNKPLVKYRTETCIILLINAWEQILKAAIQKNKWAKLYDTKNNWYKPFEECLECVKSQGATLSVETYESIKLLYKKRCRIIHYHKSIEVLDYMAIQSNIIFFRDFVGANFNRSIIKDKTWYILPIGTELPLTNFDFISHSSAIRKAPTDIKNYFQEVIRIQNSLVQKNSPGILVDVTVTLNNVQRIINPDIKVAIDNKKEETISLEGMLKVSEEGKPVTLTMGEFENIKSKYPLSYKEVLEECKKKGRIDQKKFQIYMGKCKKNQNLSVNWKLICRSLKLPFIAPDKYVYKNKVAEDWIPK